MILSTCHWSGLFYHIQNASYQLQTTDLSATLKLTQRSLFEFWSIMAYFVKKINVKDQNVQKNQSVQYWVEEQG